MPYRVPFVDPRAHYRRYQTEIDAAINECLSHGDLIYRDQLRRFEENLAAFVGVRYAVGVNSGYHALHFALLGAGVGAGDEVITVAHTFVATISSIVHCGAMPVLVDVSPDYTMDPGSLERALTPRTRAILCVHLNGRVCAMDRILAIAERYRWGLEGISALALPHFDESKQQDVFQNYVIRLIERDRLREHLRRNGVETLLHWPKPVWEHEGLGLKDPSLDETERICREVLSLPMSAETTVEHAELVVQCIREFFA